MEFGSLKRILSLYEQEVSLLESQRFGDGLWPVDPSIGQFLSWLIRLEGLHHGLEVGAGVGYSTLWIAHAFRENGGTLKTFEYFLPKVEQLEKYLKRYSDIVDIIPSDMTKGLRHFGRKKCDFVFFDQRKGDYLPHLKLLVPKLKKGAYICADNVLSHEKSCREYLDFVRSDERFESVLFPIGDGLEVSRYVG